MHFLLRVAPKLNYTVHKIRNNFCIITSLFCELEMPWKNKINDQSRTM